jgi:hypothetical protein
MHDLDRTGVIETEAAGCVGQRKCLQAAGLEAALGRQADLSIQRGV